MSFEDGALTGSEPPPGLEAVRADSRRTGSNATVDQLRGMVLSGELAPGSIISQLELARRLGVSTTPLREAMRQLQAEGLLEAELNRRPRVPHLDVDDLHALYATRILMESLAIELTVRGASPGSLLELSNLLEQMDGLARERDLHAWEVVHADFHRRITSGATAPMRPLLTSVFQRTERFRHLSVARDQPRGWSMAQVEHERIVAAMQAGDPAEAASELARHLARTAIGLSAAFAPEVDPAPVRFAVGLVTNSTR